MPIGINGFGSTTPLTGPNRTDMNLERIGSGLRINSAADDAAGLAISERMTRDVNGYETALRNLGDGSSLAKVGSGGLDNLRNDIGRARELALQAANGTLSKSDRAALQVEADQISENIQNTLRTTNFNGRNLFDSDDAISLQAGADPTDRLDFKPGNLASELDRAGLFRLDVSNPAAASSTISALDDGLDRVNEVSTQFGAMSNRIDSTADRITDQRINTMESRSRIRDADLAKEISDLSANRVREQVEVAIRGQANAREGMVLQLLQ